MKCFTLMRLVNLCLDTSIQFAPYIQARRCFALQVKCPLLQTNRNQTRCVQSERMSFRKITPMEYGIQEKRNISLQVNCPSELNDLNQT